MRVQMQVPTAIRAKWQRTGTAAVRRRATTGEARPRRGTEIERSKVRLPNTALRVDGQPALETVRRRTTHLEAAAGQRAGPGGRWRLRGLRAGAVGPEVALVDAEQLGRIRHTHPSSREFRPFGGAWV